MRGSVLTTRHERFSPGCPAVLVWSKCSVSLVWNEPVAVLIVVIIFYVRRVDRPSSALPESAYLFLCGGLGSLSLGLW